MPPTARYVFLQHFGSVLVAAWLSGNAGGAWAQFALPPKGCPMAHCDPQMSDLVRAPAPRGTARELWRRIETQGEIYGSYQGIGCSSNDWFAACTFRGASENLQLYDYDGKRLWSSGTLLSSWTFASAPLIDGDGAVIACDEQSLVKFSSSGALLWRSALAQGGIPISPVPTAGGAIVLATHGGPVYAFDATDGRLLGSRYVEDELGGGRFQTLNTPAGAGNRIYVSMERYFEAEPDPIHLARLVAIDVDPGAPTPEDVLSIAWGFDFGGPSGASPLAIGDRVYFDGDRPGAGAEMDPYLFAVQDLGPHPQELWRVRTQNKTRASVARDPRGGVWSFSVPSPWLLRRKESSGAVIAGVNVDELLAEDGTHIVTSVMTVAGGTAQPVMILSATAFSVGTSFVLAIDLNSRSLLWKVKVSDDSTDFPAGQFPILTRGGAAPRVVFTTRKGGARAIGE